MHRSNLNIAQINQTDATRDEGHWPKAWQFARFRSTYGETTLGCCSCCGSPGNI